ncbi:hypothetical protein DdX_21435 [Ditylenchus destructor]|uniref:Uncharacterized protein n=1 Tax=Ditylenchus destructor TaxID=166010 RepID=A0AAD4MJM9_9BILA|nr:hypothetical protein DdX_21435 [Ditylenchus destructor]
MIVFPFGTWLDIFAMLSRGKLDLFRMTNRTFADMIESGAKSLPLYPPSYLEIYGPNCNDGEDCIYSTSEYPSFWKPIDNDSGMTPQIIEEYIYPSPKFKVMQEWDIENPDHHLFEGQRIPQTFLDDYAGWDMNTVYSSNGKRDLINRSKEQYFARNCQKPQRGKNSTRIWLEILPYFEPYPWWGNSINAKEGFIEALSKFSSKRESPATISCCFPAARIRFPRWKENNDCTQLGNSRK